MLSIRTLIIITVYYNVVILKYTFKFVLIYKLKLYLYIHTDQFKICVNKIKIMSYTIHFQTLNVLKMFEI